MRSGVVFLALVLCACASAPKGAAPVTPKSAQPREAVPPASTTSTTSAENEDESADEEEPTPAAATPSPCMRNMVIVEQDGKRFCIDKYEAAVVEVSPDGTEKPYPHYLAVDGHAVRAVSEPGVHPQGYISEIQAADACVASGKRLCSYPEWKTACMGPKKTTFPYGEARRAGVCNDSGKSAVVAVFGAKAVANSPVNPLIAAANDPARRKGGAQAKAKVSTTKKADSSTKTKDKKKSDKKSATKKKDKAPKAVAARPASPSKMPAGVDFNVWTQLNDARLGQVEGALSKTGEHPDCANGFGVVDMVGNIHEWVATDPSAAHGTFAGGYYLDTSLNGDGCGYKTQAHAHDYHDYSTGFRCCADPKE